MGKVNFQDFAVWNSWDGPNLIYTITSLKFPSRAFTISDFHCTSIVTKQIHNNDIIDIIALLYSEI